jgi:hypothetical protein
MGATSCWLSAASLLFAVFGAAVMVKYAAYDNWGGERKKAKKQMKRGEKRRAVVGLDRKRRRGGGG